MKISDLMPNSIRMIHMPPWVKRDTLLFSALYTLNFIIYSSWVELAEVPARPWVLLPWLYGLVMFVPLLWRDEAPLVVFATQWVLTVAAWPFSRYYAPVVGIVVALYSVALHRTRRVSLLALLASCIPLGLELLAILNANASLYTPVHDPVEVFANNGALLVVAAGWAWGLGWVNQATRRRVQDLERERQAAREADVLATERRRIARELHDIVSHAVTGIVFQAAGAARVADTGFAQIRQALVHIETTGRQVMAELQRLVRVLEVGDPASHAPGIGELSPQPGLADLPELFTSLQDIGMPVTVRVEGIPRNLDPSVDLAAYRIVQEGLANVLKHAGKNSNPRLRLVWEAHSLLIQIDNDTNLAETHRGQTLSVGRGLVGLHERTQAAGGRLHAGPHHNGGYRLTATLPLATPEVSSVPGHSSQEGHMDHGKMPA